MSANSTPTFFQFLDLVIQAFHLDYEDAELSGSGPFQHQLSGRRLDINEDGLRKLLLKFSSALRRSEVFPLLFESLAWDRSGARGSAVANYLIDAVTLPCPVDDPDEALADRLAWLAEQHEELLSKARSHGPDEIDPAFGLMPVVRFARHHLTVALALLRWIGALDTGCLDPASLAATWLMESPKSTPMREARENAKLSLSTVRVRIEKDDLRLNPKWDKKTVANLERGGPSHPELKSIRAAVAVLHREDGDALPRWRRWYGLRHLARQFASFWSWEWLHESFVTSCAHAEWFLHHLQAASQASALSDEQRRTVASVGLLAGWRLGFARIVFVQAANGPGEEPEPLLRFDYRAIGTETERVRLQGCLGIAALGPSLEASLRARNQGAANARAQALWWIREIQGGQVPSELTHPGLELLCAKAVQDWPAMERASRTLVEQHPDIVLNHGFLVDALATQQKFDAALAAVRRGLDLFAADPDLQRSEIHVLMHRGDVNADRRDFELARDKLQAMELADSDWRAHLQLADCHLALGAWAEAREHCKIVSKHSDHCGEARAIAALCSAKLGDHHAENKAAQHASRRGETELLRILRARDTRGELDPSSPRYAPHWHRLYMSELHGWMIIEQMH